MGAGAGGRRWDWWVALALAVPPAGARERSPSPRALGQGGSLVIQTQKVVPKVARPRGSQGGQPRGAAGRPACRPPSWPRSPPATARCAARRRRPPRSRPLLLRRPPPPPPPPPPPRRDGSPVWRRGRGEGTAGGRGAAGGTFGPGDRALPPIGAPRAPLSPPVFTLPHTLHRPGRLKGVGRRRGSGLALGSNQGKPLMNARATDTAGGGRHGGHVTAGGRPVERRERGGHRGADEVGELRHRLAAPALRALRQRPAVRPPPARRLLPFPASISPVHPRFKPFPGGGLVPPRLANRGGATWRPEGPQGLPQVARWSAEPSAASAGG